MGIIKACPCPHTLHLHAMPFSTLGLSPALLQTVAALGFAAPTPIQAQAIPAILQGLDVLAQAQTGSGKTAAFALPLLQRLLAQPHPPGRGRRPVRTLVLVPTRELAAQVGEVLRRLAPPAAALKIAVVFGGVSINPQMMALRGGADVVVATPGRLLDLLQHNALRLSDVQQLVLDEADRLLDLGFADELQQVLQQLPAQRQSLFFSATYPPAVQALASALLRDPVRLHIQDSTLAEALQIEQRAILVDTAQRTPLLRHWLSTEGWKQVLVFVGSQYSAEHVANKLYDRGIYATAFHGGLSQGTRQEVLAQFKAGRWDVLITTDLASRGIDIAQLPVVINYDLPRSAVDYVHRIGRTGRAGAAGLAISLATPETQPHWHLIEKRQGLSLPLEQVPGFETTATTPAAKPNSASAEARTTLAPNDPNAPGNGGIKSKRPSKKDKLRAAAATGQAGTASGASASYSSSDATGSAGRGS